MSNSIIHQMRSKTPDSFLLATEKGDLTPLSEDIGKIAEQTISYLDLAIPAPTNTIKKKQRVYALHVPEFYLAYISKRIKEANRLPLCSNKRSWDFVHITNDLGKNAYIDIAIQVIRQYVPREERNFAFITLAKTFMKEKNIEGAQEAIASISSRCLRESIKELYQI